jgi:hypothetical protein
MKNNIKKKYCFIDKPLQFIQKGMKTFRKKNAHGF